MKEIEILIDKKGNIEYKVKNIKGPKCKEYSKFIEEALGEIVKQEFTTEYYEEETIIEEKEFL